MLIMADIVVPSYLRSVGLIHKSDSQSIKQYPLIPSPLSMYSSLLWRYVPFIIVYSSVSPSALSISQQSSSPGQSRAQQYLKSKEATPTSKIFTEGGSRGDPAQRTRAYNSKWCSVRI